MEETHLGIPIYLDTNTLLDLLASMEDGFSTASRTVTRDSQSKTTGISGEGSFGINVYSILKLGFKGAANKETSADTGKELEEERFHTYGSLMNRLIKNLYENDVIKRVVDEKSWNDVTESDFIELQGKFIPNPIVNSLTRLTNLFDLLIIFSEKKLIPPYDNLDNPPIPEGMTKKQARDFKKEFKKNAEDQLKKIKSMKEMLDGITKDLGGENFQKYVIELKDLPDHKIVSYLFNEFIRDRAGVELAYGEFRVLGKVVRKIEKDESIDLLEGTVVGLSDEIIDAFKAPLKDMSKQFRIPEIFTSVESPAIQIIPIAVFV
ncbi:MAG: hypothetical protein FJ150_07800 [Euryarchaeota archaeon]|nr:hypothetical protein [Euryarchaeota archaeon]